jgi:hypothetical protein
MELSVEASFQRKALRTSLPRWAQRIRNCRARHRRLGLAKPAPLAPAHLRSLSSASHRSHPAASFYKPSATLPLPHSHIIRSLSAHFNAAHTALILAHGATTFFVAPIVNNSETTPAVFKNSPSFALHLYAMRHAPPVLINSSLSGCRIRFGRKLIFRRKPLLFQK